MIDCSSWKESIIDVHTHIYPVRVIDKLIERLTKEQVLYYYPAFETFLEIMEGCGIEKAVMTPVATKYEHINSVNEWGLNLYSLSNQRIIPFTSIPPHASDALGKLEEAKSLGIKGIKLHPPQQEFVVDDEKLFPFYKKLVELDMVVLIHGGVSEYDKNGYKAHPKKFLHLKEKFPELKLVVAHLGGYMMLKEAMEYIIGKDIYIDLSLAYIYPRSIVEEVVVRHPKDKLLFASDFPWGKVAENINFINSLEIPLEWKRKIFFENAKKLLNI